MINKNVEICSFKDLPPLILQFIYDKYSKKLGDLWRKTKLLLKFVTTYILCMAHGWTSIHWRIIAIAENNRLERFLEEMFSKNGIHFLNHFSKNTYVTEKGDWKVLHNKERKSTLRWWDRSYWWRKQYVLMNAFKNKVKKHKKKINTNAISDGLSILIQWMWLDLIISCWAGGGHILERFGNRILMIFSFQLLVWIYVCYITS